MKRTDDQYREVALSIQKLTDIMREIPEASSEQAQGIENINSAVEQIDVVVQEAAANAEESASASEEMSAQAEQMRGVIGSLSEIIGGVDGHREHTKGSSHGKKEGIKEGVNRSINIPIEENLKKSSHFQRNVGPDGVSGSGKKLRTI